MELGTKESNQQKVSQTITHFLANNPHFDLEKFDCFDEDKLADILDIKERSDNTNLTMQFKALQRLYRLTSDVSTAIALYEQGLHSAWQIASMPFQQFITAHGTAFTGSANMSAQQHAAQVHRQALARKNKVVQTFVALKQHGSPFYRQIRTNNLSTATDTTFNNVPSYQQLFGDINFCNCEQCRSIFSPAAYFVDLMRLQASYIQHQAPYSIKSRRPDLWDLVLSCDNTNTLINKLDIVNKVLVQTLAGKSYQQLSAQDYAEQYQQLTQLKYPFNLPFHLPLTQIRAYLATQKTSLSTIWQTFITKELPSTNIATNRELLALSPEQWQLYKTPESDPTTLASYYGLIKVTDPVSVLKSVNVFLQQTKLTYTQLVDLIHQDLSEAEIKAGLNSQFFINATSDNCPPLTIDTDNNQLENLTLERLDHINRFVRLAQALGWSFADLDWALQTIHYNQSTDIIDIFVAINDAALPYLAWMQTWLHANDELTLNTLNGFIGVVKNYGKKSGCSFFESIFNNKTVPNAPAWPSDKIIWHVPIPGIMSAADKKQAAQTDQIQAALSAALHVSQDELLILGNSVLQAQKKSEDRALPLNLSNLSILYRLSKLPKLIGLTFDESLTALRLPGMPKDAPLKIAGVDGTAAMEMLQQLDEFTQWLQGTTFSVYQLQYILTGDSHDLSWQNQRLDQDAITNFTNGLRNAITATLLTEGVFLTAIQSLLQEVAATSDQAVSILSQEIFTILQKHNFLDSNGIVLQCFVSEQTIFEFIKGVLFPKEPIDEVLGMQISELIANTLTYYYQLQQQTFSQQLAGLLNIAAQYIPVLKIWAGLTLSKFIPEKLTVYLELLDNAHTAVPFLQSLLASDDEVVKLLRLCQQYAELITSLNLSPAEAQLVVDRADSLDVYYTVGEPKHFTVANIQTFVRFKQLILRYQDSQNSLLTYLTGKGDTELLAQITQWNINQLQSLITQLNLHSPVTVTELITLQDYFSLAESLNIDINNIWQIIQLNKASASSDYYQQTDSAATTLYAALQTRSDNSKLAAVVGQVDEHKRNALIYLVIDRLKNLLPLMKSGQQEQILSIASSRDLYEYLLIDVDVSSAVQTSYVKEAISATQLYIYRSRNNLEPAVTVATDLNRWWPWLEHYRVWQANREVFLYPENYIEPNLRQQKTPIFTDLENSLKQIDITDNSLLVQSFNDYLTSLSDIANLTVVSGGVTTITLEDNDEQPQSGKQLMIVAQTRQQPTTYYYRQAILSTTAKSDRYVPLNWLPWQSIQIQLKPVGPVNCVAAFGKWFIFWVEQQEVEQSNSNDNSADPALTPARQYTATLYYSYYDHNKHWGGCSNSCD